MANYVVNRIFSRIVHHCVESYAKTNNNFKQALSCCPIINQIVCGGFEFDWGVYQFNFTWFNNHLWLTYRSE